MSDVTTADVADTAVVAKRKDAKTAVDAELVGRLVAQARENGLELSGEDGLLQQVTRMVVESALDGEITDHLGYDHHDPAGRGTGNSRNGARTKTVVTDIGPVDIDVPRDRDGSFEPQIVRKRQRRLNGVENMVLSLSAKDFTHGEVSAHLREVYGAEVSKQTISTITDKVLDGMAVLGTDIFLPMLTRRGGGHGHRHLFTNVIPWLRHVGVPEPAIEQMTITNPRRLLTIPAR